MNNLTITEEFTKKLFLKETLEKVSKQFKSKTEIIPIDAFDLNFRLLLVGETINLELLSSGHFGHYFKPIGFFDKKLNVYILKEFENDFNQLKNKGEISSNQKIKTLNLKENAVIGAFSMEVIETVMQTKKEINENGFFPGPDRNGLIVPAHIRYDKQIIANGLKSELIMTLEGYHQFFLDDEYNLNGGIAAYPIDQDGLSINPIINYTEIYENLTRMKLLASSKII